ncbi:hypothetical protein RCS94_09625 [Orbaceae bacterium ac157xtp]
MRSIRKSHVPTVSFRFERQIAEEGSREATRATAPRRGLRVAALGNPYRARKCAIGEREAITPETNAYHKSKHFFAKIFCIIKVNSFILTSFYLHKVTQNHVKNG